MSCAIEARGLRFSYPNGVAGLAGVDLSVRHALSTVREPAGSQYLGEDRSDRVGVLRLVPEGDQMDACAAG